jgi:hypothetical protein
MRFPRFVGPALCTVLIFHGLVSAEGASAQTKAEVTVSTTVLNWLNSTFTGFSYEKSILGSPLFSAQNTALVNLFKLLGPGILRVGGNSVNNENSNSTWAPDGRGLVMGQVAPSDVDRLAGFLRATDWKVIYGLYGAGGYSSDGRSELSLADAVSLSTNEAVYAASKLGDRLIEFEIGNEPDIYGSKNANLQPSKFSEADFETLWNAYANSIRAAVPTAVFSGPASAGHFDTFTAPFAASHGDVIQTLTQHYYVGNGQTTPPPSVESLLDSVSPGTKANDQLVKLLASLQQTAATYTQGKWRMAETNSFYNCGAPGVSNNAGSALWALEYCFTLAEYGAWGVNFHGGGRGPGYTPIANAPDGKIVEARSEYYGIYLFSQLAHGMLMKTATDGPASFFAYAVAEDDGSFSMLLANNGSKAVSAEVRLPGSFKNASGITLTAPDIHAVKDMTIGGVSILADGTLSGTPVSVPMPLNQGGQAVSTTVAPGSAVWIRLSQSS